MVAMSPAMRRWLARMASRADRIALVRHGRGAALALGGGLERLADFALHQEQHVGGDLCGRAGETGQRSGDVEDAAAVGVPGDRRLLQLQAARRGRLPHGEALVAEGGERSGRTAELQGEAVALDAAEALGGGGEAGQPGRGGIAEGDRQRLLHQRAARHERGPVIAGQRGERLQRPARSARIATNAWRAQSMKAVSITSWLVAP